MRIIKKLLMVFCLFMVCASGTEAAMSSTLPQNEFSLGGISPEMTVNEVLDIYGSPTSIDNKGDLVYDYGGTVKIFFWKNCYKDSNEYEVQSVTTTANNGFATPAGLRVGMSYSEMVALYKKHPVAAGPKIGKEQGYYYYGKDGIRLLVTVADDKIISIKCYVSV